MTNQRVLDHALYLMGEDPAAGDIGDYLERAPILLCDACRALAAADRLCRAAAGMEEQVLPGGDAYGLGGIFLSAMPCCLRQLSTWHPGWCSMKIQLFLSAFSSVSVRR